MRVKVILSIITLICSSLIVNAQLSLILDDQQVEKDEVFTIDVKVAGFDSIVGMQFSMKWDEEILTPIGVENYGLPDLNSNKFGVFQDALTVQWFDSALRGVSVEDEAVIFSVKFRAIELTDATALTITNDPAVIEVFNNKDVFFEVAIDSSIITVIDDSTTSTLDLNRRSDFQLYDNQPNPFKERTNVRIDSNYPQKAQLKLFDQQGVTIKIIPIQLATGENLIELNSSFFPESGIYYYQLLTDYYATTKKLAFIR